MRSPWLILSGPGRFIGRFFLALCLMLDLEAGFSPVMAQQKQVSARPAPGEKAAPLPEVVTEAPLPYDPLTLKLAEILGSLAFLSSLCEPPEGIADRDVWREKANVLLNAEPLSTVRKERFAGAYNRGFEGYGLVYHHCTDNARLSMERLMASGALITREIQTRFGN